MNSKDGKKAIIETTADSWTRHPGGDDIAVCLISFDPKEYKFNHVPCERLLTKAMIDEYAIGPGDDVFTVGRFINHEGRLGNLPTARFGNIGQMPWEKVRQDDGFMQESFLLEARSIGGFSGSPVFVYIPVGSERPGLQGWGVPEKILKAHGPWLLGVGWGHINDWTPVCRENGDPVNPNPNALQVKLDTGMAAVVPAWKLAELLDCGPILAFRNEVERKVLAIEEAKSSTADKAE